MMTGKYGVKEEEAFYLSELYSKNHFEVPQVCQKNCFRGFWLKICSCFMDKERVKEREYRERVREGEKKGLDRIFESLLDRQTDFKHIIQLVQDVEIIKKVLFQERHLVLAPLVTLEAEKRWVGKKTRMDQAYDKEQDEESGDCDDEDGAGRGGGEGPGPDRVISAPVPERIETSSRGQDQSSTVQRGI
jgi:hypothetical protein